MTDKQKGFTIIELLLATAVFSLVLVGATSALIQIGRMYYKGLTTSNTQETARRIMEDVSRNIQFSGATPTDTPGGGLAVNYNGTDIALISFCIGSLRYSYI